jgi:hypothetical protein
VGNCRVRRKHVNSCRCRRQILAHRTGKRYAAICGCFLGLHYVISETRQHFAEGRQALLGAWLFLATLIFTCEFYVVRTVNFAMNSIMTNVLHKLLIYLSVYFCFACFGLSFSPSSGAGVPLRQWFKSPGYGVRGVGHYTISFTYDFDLVTPEPL